ncbi:hypothetical protein SAMN05444320_105389 [Streptoalloteichus hindustanus]|uniref:Uncharacterized protein n=1 Tax=Streptoalloteichus hindustanus TaxID=2017 RepID=A0A1M5FDB9_STRHI|nr:hypothetical protein SAMN05444320_105389 [Streptoalloteichus hindustanus]
MPTSASGQTGRGAGRGGLVPCLPLDHGIPPDQPVSRCRAPTSSPRRGYRDRSRCRGSGRSRRAGSALGREQRHSRPGVGDRASSRRPNRGNLITREECHTRLFAASTHRKPEAGGPVGWCEPGSTPLVRTDQCEPAVRLSTRLTARHAETTTRAAVRTIASNYFVRWRKKDFSRPAGAAWRPARPRRWSSRLPPLVGGVLAGGREAVIARGGASERSRLTAPKAGAGWSVRRKARWVPRARHQRVNTEDLFGVRRT